MKKTLKKLSAIILSSMLIFTGCSQKPVDNNNSKSSVNKTTTAGVKTFVYAIEHDVPDLQCSTGGDDSRTTAIKPLYDYLYIVANDGIRYYLVDDLKESADGLNITLHINDKAKWHDGESVTVDDLLFTLEYYKIRNSTRLIKIGDKPINYKKIDDKTVEITLPCPYSDFTTRLGKMMLYPSHLFNNDANTVEGSDKNLLGIGYGPFILKEWNKGENIIYTKNPNYYRGEAKIDQMIMKIIPEESAKEVALQNGEISFMRVSSKEKYEKYKNNENFKLTTFTESRMNYLTINPASKNKFTLEMRKAIFSAINLEEIMQVVYGSEKMSLLGQGILCPEDMNYYKDFKNYEYNLENATKLAKETGLDKITLKYIYNNNRVNMPEIAVVIQQQLKKAGINIELQGMDSPSFFGKFFSWRKLKDDWDLGTNGWDSQMGDAGYVHDYLKDGVTDSSPETRKLFSDGRLTADKNARKEKYQKGQQMLKDDYTIYPVSFPNYVIVSQKNIKGVDTLPSMLLFEDYLTLDME